MLLRSVFGVHTERTPHMSACSLKARACARALLPTLGAVHGTAQKTDHHWQTPHPGSCALDYAKAIKLIILGRLPILGAVQKLDFP